MDVQQLDRQTSKLLSMHGVSSICHLYSADLETVDYIVGGCSALTPH